MLELLLCATFTILPDYLYRRYRQGKRFGHEITLYSVWFELRFGIVACLMLTVSLITMIFYFHPSTTSATLFYRTVPIVSEVTGRVAEVHVDVSADVKQGDVLFRLDSAKQEAALLTAKRKIAEIDAAMLAAQADVMKAEGQLQEAKSSLQQAQDELDTKTELQKRNPGIVPQRDIEKLGVAVAGRQGTLDAATSSRQSAMTRLDALLPAEKASAEAALAEAAGRSGQDFHSRRHRRSRRTVRTATGGYRESNDTVGWRSHSRGRWTACSHGRVWADRGSDHEGRNGGRGHLHFQAVDDHSDGRDQCAGLHRGGPVQGR
ncbi:hypothetical protein ACVIU7_000994 [Bradyrhizobium liaoningense]